MARAAKTTKAAAETKEVKEVKAVKEVVKAPKTAAKKPAAPKAPKETKVLRIMWTNKFSGEQGYVKSIQAKKGYFENTFDAAEARKYKTHGETEKAIAQLNQIGEGENNEFTVVEG